MTEAAPKTCRGCRWAVINDPESWVGGCSMRDHGVDLDETGGVAATCPAHASSDDAKRLEEFARAVRELVKRDRYAVRGLEAQGLYPTEWSNVLNPVEAMLKEMEEA